MAPLKVGSLFAGYGGLDLGIQQVLDAETEWFCEFDEAPSKILKHHWPTVPNYGDVTKIDWETVPTVDIIAGGSPCQDLSQAGKRAGMTEGTRSNLWVNMREAIRVIKPRLVVWENVRGALSAKATSESDRRPNENHEYCLCSGPHRRGGEYSHRGDKGEVVFASNDSRNDTAGTGCDGGPPQGIRGNLEVVPEINGQMGGSVDVVRPRGGLQGSSGEGSSLLEDKEGSRPDSTQGVEYPEQPSKKGERECEVDRGGSNGVSTSKSPSQGTEQEGSTCDQCQKCGGCLNEECPDSDMESENGQMGNLKALGRVLGDLAEIGYDARWTTIRASDVGAPHQRARVFLIAYPAHPGRMGWDEGRGEGNRRLPPIRGAEIHSPKRDSETSAHAERFGRERGWATPGQEEGAQSPADRLRPVIWGDYEPAIRRWEGVVGPAPAPTEPNRNGRPRLRSEFSEWVMGLPAGHVTGVAGLSRAEQLRAIGNGVVPQQAAAALRILLGSDFDG